jgi:N,N'-diacetyllegionaminate synthase
MPTNTSTPARIPRQTAAPQAAADTALFTAASRTAPPRVCVIAEIGVNHDGRLDRALALVAAAKQAGADAIKTQLFDPRHLLSNQARLAVYQEGKAADPFDLLDHLKLGLDDLLAVRAAARREGLAFILTPFSLENFEALQRLDPDAVKIASPDAVNHPLLELMASLGRPMLISTGTAELGEIEFAARLVERQGGCLLQCVSSYPTPAEDAALGAIPVMSRRFSVPIGYSDHTTEIMTGALAVAAGACVIEKHLTYDRAAAGPDHAASFEPESFARYVQLVRQAAAMHGVAAKTVRGVEADVRCVARQSVCVKRDLPAGHVLSGHDLTIKRPGTGIPANDAPRLVGRRLARPVGANNLLSPEDLAA